MQTDSTASIVASFAATMDHFAAWATRHWLLVVLGLIGFWNLLPWLAPVFMHLGWELPARGIYFLYGFFCHQMPQRSWFLFGPQFTYAKNDILMALNGTTDPVIPRSMRVFVGTPEMGWKLAWSDRMVSFYGGWLGVGLAYAAMRKRWQGLRWQWALILLLPLALDGGSHALSDLGGLRQGFRESNAWLVTLTRGAFAPEFYASDAWGSFNSLARLVTGILGAIGLIGFTFPILDKAMVEERIEIKGRGTDIR
ncbi:MAG: hypothetical protein GXP37_07550 [Chloroflexi bacterium]|nr:hypothetical protein [Chloroflexota bacterium]